MPTLRTAIHFHRKLGDRVTDVQHLMETEMPVATTTSDVQRAADLMRCTGLDGLTMQIAQAIAFERERIAQMVERADNTMMKQDILAEHIRGLKKQPRRSR